MLIIAHRVNRLRTNKKQIILITNIVAQRLNLDMVNNDFKICFPEGGFKDEFFFSCLLDDDEGFVLEVNPINTTKILRIEFGYHIVYYENLPDLPSIKFIEEEDLDRINSQFIIGNNSRYIDRIVNESFGFYEKNEFKHFIFRHTDGLIHVIANEMPILNWIER